MPRLPRLHLTRTQFCADYGVNWRNVEEAVQAVSDAKKGGFDWICFHLFDRDYLPSIRGEALKAAYTALLPFMGMLPSYVSQAALAEHIGIMFTAFTENVVETAMKHGTAIRVPLEKAQDHTYTVRWARSPHHAVGMYETTATWPSASAGRMPLFVAPAHPATPDAYDSYWKSGNHRGRIGVAFHVASRDLVIQAATFAVPMISVPVRPADYADAPDAAISATIEDVSEWIGEVKGACE